MPRISVVIPVYNAERTLSPCLDSILKQTFNDFEVICVDDGSTDESPNLLNDYSSEDGRIRVIKQSNQFAGTARNTGMSAAIGDYVIFLDSDDFFEPNLLEDTYSRAEETNAQIVMFGARHYDESTTLFYETPWYLKTNCIADKPVFNRHDVPDDILTITLPVPWTKLYRTDFVKREGLRYLPLRNTEDSYFTLVSVAIADRIAWINKPLVNYRVGNSASSQNNLSDAPCCFIEAYRAIYDELNRRGLYQEIERSFTRAALASTAKHLELIADIPSKHQVLDGISTRTYLDMGLLEHPLEYYPVKKDYIAVKGALFAAEERLKMGGAGGGPRVIDANGSDKPIISLVVTPHSDKAQSSPVIELGNTVLQEIETIFITSQKGNAPTQPSLRANAHQSKTILCSNQNSWEAINFGISQCRGNYCAVIGSSAPVSQDLLEAAIERLRETRANVCIVKQTDRATDALPKPVIYHVNISPDDASSVIPFLLGTNSTDQIVFFRPEGHDEKKPATLSHLARTLCSLIREGAETLEIPSKRGASQVEAADGPKPPTFDLIRTTFHLATELTSNLITTVSKLDDPRLDEALRIRASLVEYARTLYSVLPQEDRLRYLGLSVMEARLFESEIASPGQHLSEEQRWKLDSADRQLKQREQQQKLQQTYNEKYERGLIIKQQKSQIASLEKELADLRRKLNYCNPKAWIRHVKRHFDQKRAE